MSQNVKHQLTELGLKLEKPPATKDSLIKILKQAATCLSEVGQSPSPSLLESMQCFFVAIAQPEMLKHQDRDVRLLVATCVCEVTRITAPEPPYSDDVLKDVFHLIVGTLGGLSDASGPSFARRVVILETLARYRSCIVMLDLECYDLINEMFSIFFAVASDDHSENILSSMQAIMVVLIEESEDIREDLLFVILSNLGQGKDDTTPTARKLAMNVITQCAGPLEPGIQQFLISSMSGEEKSLNNHVNYHEVLFDIYRCAPHILLAVIPYLTGELLTDELGTRLAAVKLVGDLFSLPNCSISVALQPIFSEFLKRLTDRVVEVRMSVLEQIKRCMVSNPSRAEASQIIGALCDRLLDYDENIRKQVVAVVCDVTCQSPDSIPVETVKLVSERLRDKSLLVKTYTMERLADIYKLGCMKSSDDAIDTDAFDWVPGKLLRCLYDKDFRSDVIETILSGSIFRNEVSTKHVVKQWLRAFAGFDKVEVKALEKLLEQKQRLQQDMQKYLSLKQMSQNDDAPEIQKKILFYFRSMSRWFPDSLKAEEHFLILDQLKDGNIWKVLTRILDPNTGFQQICTHQDDLLRILGEKHRLCDFLRILSTKCSNLLFNKEHVKEILVEVSRQNSAGNGLYITSCMSILVILARFIPLLLGGIEDDIVNLLNNDNDIIREGVLHILSEAGGIIREQLAMLSSPIELTLEQLCLEGSRKQAKYAVHALAAITKDDGLKSLSILYKRLVDMLEEKSHLPAVLQSLGCIAQTAMPVFETREGEIEEFVQSQILERENKDKDKLTACWDNRSDICSLKIFGIKTLVKSYMPVKDGHIRPGIERLFHVIRNILLFGEISKDIESSAIDKAHLKFASAKAILRLSRYWDHLIPVDIFHLTLKVTEIDSPQVKKLFLSKVHQYVKDRVLDAKYACAFLFDMIASQGPDYEEGKHNFGEIIQMYHQAKARQLSVQNETNSVIVYPEYMLPYLVHALAHHSCPDIDECKNVQAFENIYRLLHLFISMIVHGEEDGKVEADNSIERERSATLSSIFERIKESEDAVDMKKSKNSHAICDIGLSIIKRMQIDEDLPKLTSQAPLPSIIYRLQEKKEEDGAEVKQTKTWLADESSIAYFESLNSDTNGIHQVESEYLGVDGLKDTEIDGSEMPLSILIKRLKTAGKKGIKGKKEKTEKVEAQTAQSEDDIMKMVREINLDTGGVSSKFEPSNGHAHVPNIKQKPRRTRPKRKETSNLESNSVSVPKRRRSSSSHNAHKISGPWSSPKGSTEPLKDGTHQADTDSEPLSDSENKILMKKDIVGGAESDLLVSCLKKSVSTLLKCKGRGSELSSNKGREASDHRLKNTDKVNMVKSKKRKRSIAGLTKCSSSSKEGADSTKEMIGCRIKVWWPTDRKFYEGVVKSYNSKQKQHKVTYDDGDVEVLYLHKERWDVVNSGDKAKKFNSRKNLNSLEDSSGLKNSRVAHSSRKTKNSRTKGKGRQEKRTKPKQQASSKSNFSEVKMSENFDLSDDEPTTTSQVEEMNAGDSATQDVEEEIECQVDTKESDSTIESGSDQGQVDTKNQSHMEESDNEENIESRNKENMTADDIQESSDYEKPELEEERGDVPIGSPIEDTIEDHISESNSGNKTDDHHGSPTRAKDARKETVNISTNTGAEYSDDETLSTWKCKAAVKPK